MRERERVFLFVSPEERERVGFLLLLLVRCSLHCLFVEVVEEKEFFERCLGGFVGRGNRANDVWFLLEIVRENDAFSVRIQGFVTNFDRCEFRLENVEIQTVLCLWQRLQYE